MAWLVVLLVWLAALVLGGLAVELIEILAMRRRRRIRESYQRYLRLIEEESWKGPKG